MTDAPSRPITQVTTRREALIGAACSVAAGTAWVRQPRHHVSYLGSHTVTDLIPLQFAGWSFVSSSGLILPPEDQLRNQIYSQLLTRSYTDQNGSTVMFLIAYNPAQDGVVQIHRPEVCYPAGGFKLTQIDEHATVLGNGISVPSRYIVAETPIRREKILYWTRIGDAFPRRWAEQRWAVFEQNLRGLIPDGLLVRMSTTDQDGGAALLDKFSQDLYQHCGLDMKRVLAGPQAI